MTVTLKDAHTVNAALSRFYLRALNSLAVLHFLDVTLYGILLDAESYFMQL